MFIFFGGPELRTKEFDGGFDGFHENSQARAKDTAKADSSQLGKCVEMIGD